MADESPPYFIISLNSFTLLVLAHEALPVCFCNFCFVLMDLPHCLHTNGDTSVIIAIQKYIYIREVATSS
jgi:hypothetical protein